MLKKLSQGVALVALLFTFTAQADQGKFGLKFTSVPDIEEFSVSNCANPALEVFTVVNNALHPNTLTASLVNNDSLDDSAVTIVPSASNDCLSGTLGAGASCNLTLSFQTCAPGELDRSLVILGHHGVHSLTAEINATVTRNLAYVVNYGSGQADGTGTVSLCPFNDDGSLDSCTTPVLNGVTLQGPASIIMDPTESFAYISNAGQNNGTAVTVCAVNGDGSLGSDANPCVNSNDPSFNQPTGLAYDGVNGLLYVTNAGFSGTSSVSACPVQDDGSLGPCVTSTVGTNPLAIALDMDSNLAYVTDFSNVVNICIVNADSTLSSCVSDNAGSTLSVPTSIALDPTQTYAYISNSTGNSVSYCQIMADGTFDNACTGSSTAGGTLSSPVGLDLFNGFSYISSSLNNSVSVCTMNADGSLGGCSSFTDPSFNLPYDVYLIQ